MKKFLGLLSILLLLSACGGKKAEQAATEEKIDKLNGAGATFPAPFYLMAFKQYKNDLNIQVDYGAVGSGGGIRNLKDKIVDFGASDAFLSKKDMEAMPEVFHIPTCMGAVVLSYKLDGITDLKLTPELVADIFLGKITMWNDKAIAAANPKLKLPKQNITPVYRSDGSGTTFVFSDYLSKISSEWDKEIGRGKSLKWKTGIAAKGNPGVAGTIAQTQGAIGYIGSEYAFSLNLPVASLQNQSGNFIEPSVKSISAAADIQIPGDNRVMITNTSAANGYPISCFTWILVYQEQNYNNRSRAKARATKDFLLWMLEEKAQGLTSAIHYAPLPAAAVKNAKALLQQLQYNGSSL